MNWSLQLSVLANLLQIIGLAAYTKTAIAARGKLASGTYRVIDGGNAEGFSETEDLSDAVSFLLDQQAKIVVPFMTIGIGVVLQLAALFV